MGLFQAGDFVRLYHKELEAYLVAEPLHQKDRGEQVLKDKYVAGKFPTELAEELVHRKTGTVFNRRAMHAQ